MSRERVLQTFDELQAVLAGGEAPGGKGRNFSVPIAENLSVSCSLADFLRGLEVAKNVDPACSNSLVIDGMLRSGALSGGIAIEDSLFQRTLRSSGDLYRASHPVVDALRRAFCPDEAQARDQAARISSAARDADVMPFNLDRHFGKVLPGGGRHADGNDAQETPTLDRP